MLTADERPGLWKRANTDIKLFSLWDTTEGALDVKRPTAPQQAA